MTDRHTYDFTVEVSVSGSNEIELIAEDDDEAYDRAAQRVNDQLPNWVYVTIEDVEKT